MNTAHVRILGTFVANFVDVSVWPRSASGGHRHKLLDWSLQCPGCPRTRHSTVAPAVHDRRAAGNVYLPSTLRTTRPRT